MGPSNKVEVGHEAELEERRADGFRVVVVELDRQQEAGAGVAGRVRPLLLVDRLEDARRRPRRSVRGQFGEQPRGELGVDVPEGNFLEGGDAEGVFGARMRARRDEDQQRRAQSPCPRPGYAARRASCWSPRLPRARAAASPSTKHLGAVAHGGADPFAQPDRERRVRVGYPRAVAGPVRWRARRMSRGARTRSSAAWMSSALISRSPPLMTAAASIVYRGVMVWVR